MPFKVKINVNENLSYLQLINNSYIYISTDYLKTEKEILEMLSIDEKYNNITILEDNYSNNYTKEGHYKIVYQIQNDDFNKETLNINVITFNNKESTNKSEDKNQETKKETIFSKIISFFQTLFINIFTYFKNLFR